MSEVLHDLNCSWVVQVSAQLLSPPPDNALSWGKEERKEKEQDRTKQRRYGNEAEEISSQFSSLLLPFHMDYGHSQFISMLQLPAVALVIIPGWTSEGLHHPSFNGWSRHSVAGMGL